MCWYDNSIYLKASFHDFSFTFILFFMFRGKFQLAKEEDIVEKSVLSQRELCKSMPSTLPNFNRVWLKLCHEQYFFKDTLQLLVSWTMFKDILFL